MAELTYRDAVSRGIAQELAHDPNVVFFGEDVAGAGGVFKATGGLLEAFGPKRVRDAPISEQAILGAAMGAAMTGLKPIAEIMFSDFLAVCWDMVANEIAKTRYMTDGQMSLPLVVRTANGTTSVEDEDEFADHQVKYGYPEYLIQQAERATAAVAAQVNGREGPFGEVGDRMMAMAQGIATSNMRL